MDNSEGGRNDKGPADPRMPTREQLAHEYQQRAFHAWQLQACISQQQGPQIAWQNPDALYAQQPVAYAQPMYQHQGVSTGIPYAWPQGHQILPPLLPVQRSTIPMLQYPAQNSDKSQVIPWLSGFAQGPADIWTQSQVIPNQVLTGGSVPAEAYGGNQESVHNLWNQKSLTSSQGHVAQQNKLGSENSAAAEAYGGDQESVQMNHGSQSVENQNPNLAHHGTNSRAHMIVSSAANSCHTSSGSSQVKGSAAGYMMSVPEFVLKHCKGTLAKWYKLFYGDLIPIAKTKGCKVLRMAYKYVIKEYKENKRSWAGNFTPIEMKTNGSDFHITKQPEAEATVDNLLIDLDKIIENMIVHFTIDGSSAIFICHLLDFCKNLPETVKTSEDMLDRLLMFISYHPAFGYSMERADLIKYLGKLSHNCSGRYIPHIMECFQRALEKNNLYINKGVDWREIAKTHQLMYDILMNGCTPEEISGNHFRYSELGGGLIICCRNTIEHAPKNTLVTVSYKKVWLPKQKIQQPTEPSLHTIQNEQQAVHLDQLAHGRPSKEQPMASPREVEYAVGRDFDKFIADSIFNLLSESRLDKCKYLHERWAAFKRSVDADGDDEE